MIIAAEYEFNGGSIIEAAYPAVVDEVHRAIDSVDAEMCRNKVSEEVAMQGRRLYSPISLNASFASEFGVFGWSKQRVRCDYPTHYYRDGYQAEKIRGAPFREMDFLKDRIGVEVQFGKYAFMVYNVCAKMTIFHNLGFIDAGIEIVPVKGFADDMSSGVSYFEQFVWDLEQRGVADIDIPVMIYGVDA